MIVLLQACLAMDPLGRPGNVLHSRPFHLISKKAQKEPETTLAAMDNTDRHRQVGRKPTGQLSDYPGDLHPNVPRVTLDFTNRFTKRFTQA